MRLRLQMFCLFLFLLSTTACVGGGSGALTSASSTLATLTTSPPASLVSSGPALTPTLALAATAIPTVAATETATPSPSPTPDLCSPALWEKTEIYVLSWDLFDALRPGGPRTFDRILVERNPAWAEFRQEIEGEGLWTAGQIFSSFAWGYELGTGVNPAVILVTYGVAHDWALPPNGDLASRVDAIREALYQAHLEWFLGRVDRTRYPGIANGPTYALYRFFQGDLHKLEVWCRTFVEVYGIWPVETSTNVDVVVPTPFSPPVTSTSAPTVTSKPSIWYTPSPYPTMPLSFVPLEPVYVEHWRDFESALTSRLLEWVPPDQRLCEWIILHVSKTERSLEYDVWAVCMEKPRPDGLFAVVSMPVKMQFLNNRVIEVEIPEPGTHYGPSIRRMFPEDVQEKIFNFQAWLDITQLKTHLIYRFEYPGTPPLIVLSATPTP